MIYTPRHFCEGDRNKLVRFMRQHSFATLISAADGEPSVAHVPVIVDEAARVARTHVARANPIWRDLSPEGNVLLIFHGPHHYISPSWYALHPSVPTWNYAVVHVTGIARIIDGKQEHNHRELQSILRELVEQNEATQNAPWKMVLPDDYLRRMIAGIVALEVEISSVTGKFKLSQNRPKADRENVIATLKESGTDSGIGVADLMEAVLNGFKE